MDARRAAAWLVGRPELRSQSGISLITTLMLLSAIALSGTMAISYTSQNTRAAEFSSESDRATVLAEAGMNFARSVLWEAANAGDPLSSATLPTAASPASVTIEGENVSYYGTFDAVTSTWTLVGEVTTINPAGVGSVVRAVESQVAVAAGSGGGGASQLWDFNFAEDGGQCLKIENNSVFDAPLKLQGSLCIGNNADFTGETLDVSGTLTVENNGAAGVAPNASSPITSANVAGGCTGTSQGGASHFCANSDRVWAQSITQTGFTYTAPAIDWQYYYDNASPGPKNPCTSSTGSPPSFDNNSVGTPSPDGSLGTVDDGDIAPNSDYSCTTADGEISWDASEDTLTISGTMFFDADKFELNNNTRILYEGTAMIYVYGEGLLKNNVALCGARDDDDDLEDYCTEDWDPETDALVMSFYKPGSTAFEISNNARYQGGAIMDGNYILANNAENWGPVIADGWTIENNSGQFTPIPMPSGAPSLGGGSPVGFTLANVDFSYRSYTPGAGSDRRN